MKPPCRQLFGSNIPFLLIMLLPDLADWCVSRPSGEQVLRTVLVALLAVGAFNLFIWFFFKGITFAATRVRKDNG